MDKAITTALLIIAGVVCMIFVFNSVYPMVNRSSAAMVSMAEQVDQRMQSRISIVLGTPTANQTEVDLWIKNIGTQTINNVSDSDLFFGLTTDFTRIPYASSANGTYPQWSYQIENGTEWDTSATIKITITYSSALSSGNYYAKFIIPNGISDEYYLSM